VVPKPAARVRSANHWSRRLISPRLLTKSKTTAFKADEEVKVGSLENTLDKPRRRRSDKLLSKTFNPGRLRSSQMKRGEYDTALNTSFKRRPVLSTSIERKYSWLKRFKLAGTRLL
jgi:hypothetical protein